jgi:hypothetical protein
MGFAFFTSYARLDGDKSLRRFASELKEEVRSATGLPAESIAFFDTTNIENGDDWAAVLSDGLCTSQLCVCLCSPTYFNSRFCGKEYSVFSTRRAHWLEQPANAGKRPRVIFPVVWQISASRPPAAVTELQDSDDAFPKNYREMGLRALAKLKGQKDNYTKVKMALAQRMRDALHAAQLPDLPALPHFDEIPSAFHDTGPAATGWLAPYSVAVVFCHAQGADWRPYAEADFVGVLAEAAASKLKLLYGQIAPDATLIQRLADAHQRRDAVLVLTDAASLASHPEMAAALNSPESANAALLTIWSDSTVDRTAGEQSIRALVPKRSEGAAARFDELTSILSAADLRAKLETAMVRVRSALIAEDRPVRRVEDAAIEREAQRDGIPFASAPGISGPGGGAL